MASCLTPRPTASAASGSPWGVKLPVFATGSTLGAIHSCDVTLMCQEQRKSPEEYISPYAPVCTFATLPLSSSLAKKSSGAACWPVFNRGGGTLDGGAHPIVETVLRLQDENTELHHTHKQVVLWVTLEDLLPPTQMECVCWATWADA